MAYIDTRTKKNVFTSYFLRSHFLFVMKILRTSRWDDCSYEKGSLRKDIPSIGTLVGLLLALTWQAASALLGLASLPWTLSLLGMLDDGMSKRGSKRQTCVCWANMSPTC